MTSHAAAATHRHSLDDADVVDEARVVVRLFDADLDVLRHPVARAVFQSCQSVLLELIYLLVQ